MTSHRQFQPSHSQSGFALVLVLGILLVAAAITATLMARQENETVWAPIEGTQTQMASVEKAIAAYERKNHRLPLPAARTAEKGLVLHVEATGLISQELVAGKGSISKAPSEIEDAIKDGATAISSDGGISFASNSTDPNNIIVIGAIPTETLGLPREAAEDAYGRLLTYAVTLSSTNPFTYDSSDGAITLKDAGGTTVGSKLTYIVLAHGKEGAGAWNAKSRFKGKGCDGSMANNKLSGKDDSVLVSDQANCDENDATFIMNDVTLVSGDEFFDDQLLKGEKDKVALTSSKPCPSQTVSWGPGGACAAKLVEPGVMHNGSNLEPRAVLLQVNATCPPCPAGHLCKCSPEEASGGVTGEVTVTCNNGTLVLTNPSCTIPAGACALPWGGTVPDGGSARAYRDATAADAQSCVFQDRTCDTGVLSGSYTNQNCEVEVAAANCTTPWGATVPDGGSVTAYSDPVACPPKQVCTDAIACNEEERVCNNGVLSGSFTNQQCSGDDAVDTSCSTPWGDTVANGDSITSYGDPSAGEKGSICDEQVHVCTSGEFDVPIDGSRHQSCEDPACVPNEKEGITCDGDGSGEITVDSCIDDNGSGVSNGQCGVICDENPMVDCMIGTAAVPARCNNATMTADPSCGGGGKDKATSES